MLIDNEINRSGEPARLNKSLKEEGDDVGGVPVADDGLVDLDGLGEHEVAGAVVGDRERVEQLALVGVAALRVDADVGGGGAVELVLWSANLPGHSTS
ncbi:hypothetical protein [Streptomyces sp. NPDC050804]|uniref:hypothetical protein n=1 Tax=Streptomyces sp. NPDC050804 TaxID=3154745 RepID=UPI003431C3F0